MKNQKRGRFNKLKFIKAKLNKEIKNLRSLFSMKFVLR